MLTRNLHRRHLGDGEQKLAAARYATAKAGQNQHTANSKRKTDEKRSGQNGPTSPTNADAAKRFNVSEREVKRAKQVTIHGTPALQEAVADGTLSVSDATKIKARVEHRLGEVLAKTVKHEGSRGQLKGNTVLPQEKSKPPEITKMQSSRTQQLAAIPWEEIERRIDAKTLANEKGHPMTPPDFVQALSTELRWQGVPFDHAALAAFVAAAWPVIADDPDVGYYAGEFLASQLVVG